MQNPHISASTLAGWFKYHPPSGQGVVDAHEKIRTEYGTLAAHMNGLLPESAEKTIALRKIHEAMMAANFAIALHQKTGTVSGEYNSFTNTITHPDGTRTVAEPIYQVGTDG